MNRRAIGLIVVLWLFTSAPPLLSESNTTNVLDGVANTVAGPYTLGDTGPFNFLLITNGGALSNIVGTVGNGPAAHRNEAIVTGLGSHWSNESDFTVGMTGAWNRVSVFDGAQLRAGRNLIGSDAASVSNSIHVSGPGSWYGLFRITIGGGGAGNEFTVSNGGVVYAPVGANIPNRIGDTVTSRGNRLVVTGAGTSWTSDGIAIGHAGPENSLSVREGARMTNAHISMGSSASSVSNRADVIGPGSGLIMRTASLSVGGDGARNQFAVAKGAELVTSTTWVGFGAGSSNNQMLVSGSGSMWSNRFAISVGASGSRNRLTVADGASAMSGSAVIGQSCIARDNLALVTGAGTVWSNGMLEVGFCSTNNTLIISNGASVYAGLVRSSVQGGVSNHLAVVGPGSVLSAAGDLVVGNSGRAATLLVNDAARVLGRHDSVGSSGLEATALVVGPGTLWSNASLTIGNYSWRNGVRLLDGAVLDSSVVNLGGADHADQNTLTLDGDVVAIVRTNLNVGVSGDSNQMWLLNRANVDAGHVTLGSGLSGDANILGLTGAGSALRVQRNLWVGDRGSGNQLWIGDRARADSDGAVIGGNQSFRSNQVTVTDAGSVWNNTNALVIGSNGTHHGLLVSNGALVQNGTAVLGQGGELIGGGARCGYVVGESWALVTDPGSRWDTAARLVVGGRSIRNSLVVSNGGCVTAGQMILGERSGFTEGDICNWFTNANRIVIDGGSLLLTNGLPSGFGGFLDIRHGTLTLRSGHLYCGRLNITNGPYGRLEFFGGTLRISDVRIQGSEPFVVGDGIHRADLLVQGGDNLADQITVLPNSRVRGWGTFYTSALIVTNAGIILRDDRRQLAFPGLVQQPGAAIEVELFPVDPGQTRGPLAIGDLLLDGVLRVRLRAGFNPASSEVFPIVWATTLTGAFANVPFGQRVMTVDRLGTFLVQTNGNFIELSDYQTTDGDADGMEDAWAAQHFGHSPLTASELSADADSDGLDNSDEFKAGTDPLNAGSSLKLSVRVEGQRTTVSFACLAGKVYRVWHSEDINTWQEVPNPTFAFPEAGRCEWTDDGNGTGGLQTSAKFYRLTVE